MELVDRMPTVGGRPPKITEDMKDVLVRRYNRGDTCKAICADLGISRGSYYRILKERRPMPQEGVAYA